ncbi:unnamed protein product [Candidula unifasciata]|uniref:Thioredoxin domain-containing protein n=1 Tax=Candidula unifasciata TaxID=100452 RepID=A0A8S3ZCD9_9EUPU|nr:unnamed protein product [Candidula unifasciata]
MYRALYGDEADEMASRFSAKQNDSGVIPFLDSRSIKPLSSANFSQILGKKDSVALVMFYDPECIYCQSAKPHFLKAAKTAEAKNRVFATVDCSQEEQLCALEHVKDYPTFKLFVGGKFLARYNQTPNFTTMRNFVENAPLTNNVDDFRYRNEQKTDVKFVQGGQKQKQEL